MCEFIIYSVKSNNLNLSKTFLVIRLNRALCNQLSAPLPLSVVNFEFYFSQLFSWADVTAVLTEEEVPATFCSTTMHRPYLRFYGAKYFLWLKYFPDQHGGSVPNCLGLGRSGSPLNTRHNSTIGPSVVPSHGHGSQSPLSWSRKSRYMLSLVTMM